MVGPTQLSMGVTCQLISIARSEYLLDWDPGKFLPTLIPI